MRRYLAVLIALFILFPFVSAAWAQGVDEAGTEAGPDVEGETGEVREPMSGEEAADESGMQVGPAMEGEGGTLDESVKDFMDRSHEWFQENRLFGKIILRPYVMTSFVYDDNIYMNAKDEPNTLGRVDDIIWDSTVKLHFVIPTNGAKTKFFQRDEMMILGYDFNSQYYFDYTDTSSVNQYIWTDLFGFFKDILSPSVSGNGWYGKLSAEWSDVSDPIDILLRDLNIEGFPVEKDIDKLQRQKVTADAAVGWTGNKLDAELGYDFYWLDFADDAFEQANQTQNTVFLEVGYLIPGTKDIRAYVRGRYTDLDFTEELLNNAKVQEYDLGAEGVLISRKLRFVAEGGWLIWDHQETGLSGDDSDYNNATYLLRLIYKPFEGRSLRFQLEGSQQVDWSVISNYNLSRPNVLTVFDELIRKRLDADLTASFTYNRPSEGPIRHLWEFGAGLTWHPVERVNVFARYLYRNQKGFREISITTTDPDTNLPFTLTTDSSFYQNILQLGISFDF